MPYTVPERPRVLLVPPPDLPVPAVQGGAVETLLTCTAPAYPMPPPMLPPPAGSTTICSICPYRRAAAAGCR